MVIDGMSGTRRYVQGSWGIFSSDRCLYIRPSEFLTSWKVRMSGKVLTVMTTRANHEAHKGAHGTPCAPPPRACEHALTRLDASALRVRIHTRSLHPTSTTSEPTSAGLRRREIMATNSLHTAALNSTSPKCFITRPARSSRTNLAEQYGLVRSLLSQDPKLVNAVDEV